MQKYYCKGWTNYRTMLMQVTYEKWKGVGVFVKQFLMVKLRLRKTAIYLFSNFRFVFVCKIIRKSVVYLMFKTGLQFIHFDGCFRL